MQRFATCSININELKTIEIVVSKETGASPEASDLDSLGYCDGASSTRVVGRPDA